MLISKDSFTLPFQLYHEEARCFGKDRLCARIFHILHELAFNTQVSQSNFIHEFLATLLLETLQMIFRCKIPKVCLSVLRFPSISSLRQQLSHIYVPPDIDILYAMAN